MTRTALALLAVLWPASALADPIAGPVAHIRDGDTLVIGRQPVRLCGIQAPEKGRRGAREATAYLTRLVRGKAIRCVPVGDGTPCDGRSPRRSHDRIVAQCFAQGRDIAEAMVRAGHACAWLRYSGEAYGGIGRCVE